ncbi:MAG: hypothetical protein ACREL3_04645 [Gemmatimonadales bacterium]
MSLTDKEKFELAREIIRHEDGLVNNRVTWLLVVQGFLLSAFVGGAGLYGKLQIVKASIFITTGLLVIGFLGIIVSLTARNTIHTAFRHINEVQQWWNDSKPSESLPPLAGRWPGYSFSTGNLPNAFVAVWIVLLVLLLAGVVIEFCGRFD